MDGRHGSSEFTFKIKFGVIFIKYVEFLEYRTPKAADNVSFLICFPLWNMLINPTMISAATVSFYII